MLARAVCAMVASTTQGGAREAPPNHEQLQQHLSLYFMQLQRPRPSLPPSAAQPHFLSGPIAERATKHAPNITQMISGSDPLGENWLKLRIRTAVRACAYERHFPKYAQNFQTLGAKEEVLLQYFHKYLERTPALLFKEIHY